MPVTDTCPQNNFIRKASYNNLDSLKLWYAHLEKPHNNCEQHE